MARVASALVVAIAVAPGLARAQDGPARRVDASHSVVLANAETMAMGGAGIAIATGANGMLVNPAATATRRQDSRAPWMASGTVNLHALGPGYAADLGNTGGEGWSGTIANLGVMGGYETVGLALVASGILYEQDDAEVLATDTHLGLGFMAAEGRVGLGVGIRGLTFQTDDTTGRRTWAGTGLQGGATVHDPRTNVHAGLVARARVRAEIVEDSEGEGLGLDEAWAPGELGLGVAWIRDPSDDRMPLRLLADVTVLDDVPQGVALEPLIRGQIRRKGERVTVTPRLGTEFDPWRDRLHVRAGTYLEPGRIEGADARLHATAGLEVRLFRIALLDGLVDEHISWRVAADVARSYLDVSWLGIGFWHDGTVGGKPWKDEGDR